MSTATAARWSRDLLFHALGVATATLGCTLWWCGVTISLTLAITYFGLVFALGTLVGCKWFARLERRRAALVLGAPIGERYRPIDRGARWTKQLHALMGDAAIWRDFAWAAVCGYVGLVLSTVAVSLWLTALGFVTLPAWYWSLPDGAELGILNIDTLPLAFAATGVGILLVPVAGLCVRGLTIAELAWMRWLLAPHGDGPVEGSVDLRTGESVDVMPPLTPPLHLHVAVSALIAAVVTIIYVATGLGSYFWPMWVYFGLSVPLGLVFMHHRAKAVPRGPTRALRIHADASVNLASLFVVIWLLSGPGSDLWPFWPILGLAVPLALHALFVFRDQLPLRARVEELVDRVDVLTKTRQGALDVQAAELRRIERDLHDGAQARLVALSMQLGRAEERVADQPEVAELLRAAREDAGAAIAELRDLARGIAPPILADRGLTAAIEALGRRSQFPVTVELWSESSRSELAMAGKAGHDQRPLPVVETAAYFVVAESLTNVAKHARGATATVHVGRVGDDLVVEIADDGPGGATPDGSGLSGLRQRVEALDGTLTVTSPPGRGTTISAVLPCGP